MRIRNIRYENETDASNGIISKSVIAAFLTAMYIYIFSSLLFLGKLQVKWGGGNVIHPSLVFLTGKPEYLDLLIFNTVVSDAMEYLHLDYEGNYVVYNFLCV